MQVRKCDAGHFFDFDKYVVCPYCDHPDPIDSIPEDFSRLGSMEKIGEGAFGSVIKITGEKTLALKTMNLQKRMMKDIAEREIEIMEILNETSSSVKLIDSRIENNNAYILMEFHKTLSEYIKESNPTKKEMLKVLISLCESASEMHEKGIIHLDIQPRNIFITDEGKAVLSDFGSAVCSFEAADNKVVRGTLSYMAPEMRREAKCGSESDVYCIGMLIYAMFNNRYLPFMDEFEKSEADRKRLSGEEFPELKNSDIMQVIRKACAFNPDERIKDVAILKSMLLDIYEADASDLSELVVNNKNNTTEDRVYDSDEVAYSFAAETTYFPDIGNIFDNPNVAETEYIGSSFDDDRVRQSIHLTAPSALSTEEIADHIKSIMGNIFDADGVASTSVCFDPGPKKEIKNDDVNFSAVSSSEFVKGEYTDIDIVLYEDEYRNIVDDLVSKHEGKGKEKVEGLRQIARYTKIKVVLSSPDFEIEDDTVENIWNGNYLVFNFVVKIPEKLKAKQVKFTANISVDGVALTRLTVFGDVVKKANKPVQNFLSRIKLPVKRYDIKSAFISYSSEDRSTVASRIQGMKSVRPDLNIFFDLDSIRTGSNWEEVILDRLKSSDVLYLFWSKNAAASEWVDKEWRYMYRNKGEEAIEPVPLDRPEECPPPKELNKKHFNDILLYITNE